MPSAKSAMSPAEPPDCFFARELAGEAPLSLATARELCALAIQFGSAQPWRKLADSDLIFVRLAAETEDHACSVMGAAGQVFSLMVYLGAQGYQFFRKLQESEEIDLADFLAEQRTVSAEFSPRKDLTRQDRELLEAVGYRAARGSLSPQFRSARPGYTPWYITENEGRLLSNCLTAVTGLLQALEQQTGGQDLWSREGVFPLMTQSDRGFDLQMFTPPKPVTSVPVAPPLDQAQIDRILAAKPKTRGALELDHFYAPALVGKNYERKACMRLAMAIDAETAFAHAPELAKPDVSAGEMLSRALLKAVESGGVIPEEVRVRRAEYRALLEPLAQSLQTRVRAVKTLPALEFAKKRLFEMLEDG